MTVNRVAAMVSSIAVLIVVFAAFLMLGSPAQQRLKRLDERRVADLQRLAYTVDRYWAERGALPSALNELVDGRRLSELPTDPATRQPYRFEILSEDRYRLCAEFAHPADPAQTPTFWQHDAGRGCYTFVASDEETGAFIENRPIGTPPY